MKFVTSQKNKRTLDYHQIKSVKTRGCDTTHILYHLPQ